MAIKEQWNVIKKNWLLVIILLVVVFLVLPLVNGVVTRNINFNSTASMDSMGYASSYEGSSLKVASYGGGYYPNYSSNFAPEVTTRMLTRTATISNEVKKGTFIENQDKIKNLVKAFDGYLLSENASKYGEGASQYSTGYYSVKVETDKYQSFTDGLKGIGKVTSFYETTEDITGNFSDLSIELATEKEKLARYEAMYEEAINMSDKITLSDSIFNEQRIIGYYQKSLDNLDKQVSYSTVSITLTEKQSGYAGIAVSTFSSLVKSLVNSFNSLIRLIFVVLPYAIVLGIIALIVKLSRKKKRR